MTYKIIKEHRRGEEVIYVGNDMDELARYLDAKTGRNAGFDIGIGGDDFEL